MSDQHVFAIAPLEMARDHRLTAAQYRVLLALLSFRNAAGELIWPLRSRLAELTGYTVNSISKYTSQLEGLGWLTKEGRGECGQAVRYRIIVPDMDGEVLSKPKAISKSDAVSGRKPISKLATKTLLRLDKRIGQTKANHAPQKETVDADTSNQATPEDTQNHGHAYPQWLNVNAWEEFVQHRKEIRKKLTPLATKKALKALKELTPEQQRNCIDTTIQAGWTGLFPEKFKNETHSGHHKKSSIKIINEIARDYVAEHGYEPIPF